MREAGFTSYWARKMEEENDVKFYQTVKPESDTVDLLESRSIFAILLIGLPIATICFTLETISFLKMKRWSISSKTTTTTTTKASLP